MDTQKIETYCNRIIEIAFYVIVFYIPIASAIVESFMGVAICAWLFKKFFISPKQPLFFKTPLNVPIVIYFLVCFLAVIFSSNHGISIKTFIGKTVEYFLLFFIVVETVDKRILKNILIVFIGSASLLSIDGIYQYFSHIDFLRHRNQPIAGRVNGPFSTPNDFANYMVTLFPLIASVALIKFKKLRYRITIAIISLAVFFSLIISTTRASWVAFLLAMPLIAIMGNKKLFIWMLLLTIVVLSLTQFLPGPARMQISNFLNLQGWKSAQRQIVWKMSFNMFLEKPILGQGLGTFMHNFSRFVPKDYPEGWGASYAHNCFLQIAAETGVLGLLAFISIIVVLFVSGFKALKKIKDQRHFYFLSGLLVSIFVYLVGSFFDTHLYSLAFSFIFWLMVGMTVKATIIISKDAS